MSDRTDQRDAIAATLKDFDTLSFPMALTQLTLKRPNISSEFNG
jgi:hypothetical protein